ncbi:MAG TPA: hypothetical protein VGM77_05265 [Gemmatimonadales bacterium]|jgi:hypothetical protein
MNEPSPFDAGPDAQLGAALRDALAMPFGAAFVQRVRARLVTRQRTWDEELAGWFWQGLVAASLVTVLAGWGLNHFSARDEAEASNTSVASQLLEGSTPGVSVLIASMRSSEAP